MKLQTLKDLDVYWLEGFNTEEKGSGCKTLELKQEAIKWIKELKRKSQQHSYKYGRKNTEENFYGICISWIPEDDGVEGAIAFIKHFFNITEEELLDKSSECSEDLK